MLGGLLKDCCLLSIELDEEYRMFRLLFAIVVKLGEWVLKIFVTAFFLQKKLTYLKSQIRFGLWTNQFGRKHTDFLLMALRASDTFLCSMS